MYSTILQGFQYERNISGGIGSPLRSVTLVSPDALDYDRTQFEWDASGSLADEFRLTLGSFPGGDDYKDSDIINTTTWAFDDIPMSTVYLTLYSRFGATGTWATLSRVYFREAESFNPSGDGLWHDDRLWSDTNIWIE